MSLPALFPSPKLFIPSKTADVEYVLRGIIYLGNYHFTARLVDGRDGVWQYDGRINGGLPAADLPASHCVANNIFTSSSLLNTHGPNEAHLLVYALREL
ncbi:hypothetical protein DEU56DRAFT_744957 [Suillus clintonianus]|uniref:uncharacterized protein n=1 Tax=Suillus clintonianus TaxID=1904413 RepID=UPI001B8869A1|nr:uncharacterized protein DEU56DRAFT_744957 [Suillus clintonianus]KAG2124014.1 hypothetical protein DEU56DRAFT_744957 [Suillus clintonianus]